MRKSFILALLLLTLSVALICSAGVRINEARDDVTFEETVLYGNRSAADGLALELRTHSFYRLFWDISYVFDAVPEINTDFTFSQFQKRQVMERVYSGVNMSIYTDVQSSTSGSFDLDNEITYGLPDIYRDVASRTSPGEERVETVTLSDYYDFYPIDVYVDLPVQFKGDEGGINPYDKLSKIFRIAISDDFELEIRIRKNNDGEVYEFGSSTLNGYLNLWSKSVQTEDGCYFIFNSRALDGTAYDVSHIPLGYGIYYFPYNEENGYSFVSADSLSMVYELAPGTEIIELISNDEQSQLLLLTSENQKCVLTVIDIAAMSRIQRLELFDYPIDTGLAVYPYRDFLVLISRSIGKLAVVTPQSSGEYRLELMTELKEAQNDHDATASMHDSPVMAYDGKRLAIAVYSDIAFFRYVSPSFYIFIYDESGLAYSGHYISSLAVGGDVEYSYISRRIDHDPMSVYWKN